MSSKPLFFVDLDFSNSDKSRQNILTLCDPDAGKIAWMPCGARALTAWNTQCRVRLLNSSCSDSVTTTSMLVRNKYGLMVCAKRFVCLQWNETSVWTRHVICTHLRCSYKSVMPIHIIRGPSTRSGRCSISTRDQWRWLRLLKVSDKHSSSMVGTCCSQS